MPVNPAGTTSQTVNGALTLTVNVALPWLLPA